MNMWKIFIIWRFLDEMRRDREEEEPDEQHPEIQNILIQKIRKAGLDVGKVYDVEKTQCLLSNHALLFSILKSILII